MLGRDFLPVDREPDIALIPADGDMVPLAVGQLRARIERPWSLHIVHVKAESPASLDVHPEIHVNLTDL